MPTQRAIPTALFGLSLVVVTLLVYANSFTGPFLLDDSATIPGNPSITRLWPLSAVLFPSAEAYSAGRPLLNLSFALNHAIGGTSVRGYHVANLAIHLAAALTLFGIVRRTLALPKFRGHFADAARPLAFAIAALWAVHPVQTVSVTYISQRAESLMGLFYLLTLYCFIRRAEKDSVGWTLGSILACAAGMATKEVMVTAPVLVFLYDWQCLAGTAREAWRQRWRHHLALGATWLVLVALMVNSQLSQRAVGLGHGVSSFDYTRLECRAVVYYLRIAIWPASLVFDHGADLPLPTSGETVAKGALLLGLMAIASWGLWRGRVWGLLGCAFFLLLAPTSSVVPVAGQPIAENRMYLPLAAVLIAAGVGLFRAVARHSLVCFAALVCLLGGLAYARNATFGTEVGIWSDTTAKQPLNARAWVYLSLAYAKAGQPNEAMATLTAALRHRPDNAELHSNLAVVLFKVGQVADAVAHLQTAIRLKPDYADAHYNLGAILYRTNNPGPALACFQNSLRLKPNSVEAQNYAGLCSLRLGDLPRAIQHFQRAVQMNPNHPDAPGNLKYALSLQK